MHLHCPTTDSDGNTIRPTGERMTELEQLQQEVDEQHKILSTKYKKIKELQKQEKIENRKVYLSAALTAPVAARLKAYQKATYKTDGKYNRIHKIFEKAITDFLGKYEGKA